MDTTRSDASVEVTKYETIRFGEIEVRPSEILTFPEGLLGFHEFHRYILLKEPDQDPFLWMQSLEDPTLAFVVVNPFLFFPGYEIQVKPHELATIQLDDVSKATVLTIITIPENPMDLTANLRGPIVINSEKNLAKQLVLIDDRYHTKHPLLKEIPPELAAPPGGEETATSRTENESEESP